MELKLNLFNSILALAVIQGFTFGLLFCFVKRQKQYANRYLAIILFIFSFYLAWVVLIDTRIQRFYPHLLYFPLGYLLALGPSIYFYVQSSTTKSFQFGRRQLLHYSPLLLELSIHACNVQESWSTGKPMFETNTFYTFSPVIQLLSIISIMVYSILAVRQLDQYEKWMQNEFTDELKYSLAWLKKLLIGHAILWIMWVPYTFVDYFFFNWELSIRAYYPLYLFTAVFTLWIALEAYRRPEMTLSPSLVLSKKDKEELIIEEAHIQEKAITLQQLVEEEEYFLNPDISLSFLAKELDYSPNLLSKIINTGLRKNFSDFINEFRVKYMKNMLHNEKYDHYTTEGIAYECGFNSRATAIRTFKKFTGISPAKFRKTSSRQF